MEIPPVIAEVERSRTPLEKINRARHLVFNRRTGKDSPLSIFAQVIVALGAGFALLPTLFGAVIAAIIATPMLLVAILFKMKK